MTHSILIIGASGRLGLALIREASKHPSHPSIHAFVRTPSKIPTLETALCTTIQTGDALNPDSISRALHTTGADTVIITIGIPDSTAPTTLREDSANALVSAINTGFEHLRIVCVSSIGAGGSSVVVGLGVGQIIRFRLRHLLEDHDKQEEALWRVGEGRVMIVRPTGLVDGKPRGKVVTFGDAERCPSVSIDREEVGGFIVEQVCGSGKYFGRKVNIASTSLQNGQWGIKALLTLV